MPTSLRQQLDSLAASFANGVLHAIRSASIEDLLAESGGSRRLPKSIVAAGVAGGSRRRTGRLARRSAEDIGQVIDRIVSLVKQSPKGMRAEEIRQKLDMQAKEMPRPLKEAVEAGRLSKSGQKRATTYVARGGGAAAKPVAGKAGKAGKAAKARKGAKKAKKAKRAK
jgi:predicted HTH transcriptional regulator